MTAAGNHYSVRGQPEVDDGSVTPVVLMVESAGKILAGKGMTRGLLVEARACTVAVKVVWEDSFQRAQDMLMAESVCMALSVSSLRMWVSTDTAVGRRPVEVYRHVAGVGSLVWAAPAARERI